MQSPNNLTFESDQSRYKSRSILGQAQTPKMTKFLIGKGLVKNEKQAQGLLLITTVLFLIASIYIFAVFVFDVQLFNKTPTQTPEQIQRIQENRERMENMRNRQKPIDTTNTTNPQ